MVLSTVAMRVWQLDLPLAKSKAAMLAMMTAETKAMKLVKSLASSKVHR